MRLRRCLWMALYLKKYGWINPKIAFEHLGISRRSYNRYLVDLKEAGVIMDNKMNGNRGMLEGIYYVAFDEVMAPVKG